MNLCALPDDVLTCIFARLPAEFLPILREVCQHFHNKVPCGKISTDEFVKFIIQQKYINILQWYIPCACPLTKYTISYFTVNYGTIEILTYVSAHGCKFDSNLFNTVISRAKIDMMDFMWNIGCVINRRVWDHAIDSANLLVFEWLHDHGFRVTVDILMLVPLLCKNQSLCTMMQDWITNHLDRENNDIPKFVQPISGYYT